MVGEMIVDQSAVIGIEGWHLGGLSTVNDSLGQMFGFFEEILFLDLAVMINIHPDAGGVPVLGLHDSVDQVLDVVKTLAMAADQEIRFAGQDLYRGFISR